MTRSKSIKIRLTDQEYRRLKTIGGARGVSALLRRRALDSKSGERETERLAVLRSLTVARNALIQIARNSERQPLPDQLLVVMQLAAIERALLIVKNS